MTYGLLVTTENGDLQIDTDRSYQGLTAIAAGTSSSPYAGYTPPSGTNTILMASVTPASGSFTFITFDFVNNLFKKFDTTTGLISETIVNWVILQRTDDLDVANKVGDYGLQVFNSDGEEQYDSRYYDGQGEVGILGYYERLSLNGGGNDGYPFFANGSTVNRVTSDINHYVTFGQSPQALANYVSGASGPSFQGFFVANNFNNKTGTGTNVFTGSGSPDAGEVYSGYYPYRIRQTPKTPGSFQWFQNFGDTLYGEKF